MTQQIGATSDLDLAEAPAPVSEQTAALAEAMGLYAQGFRGTSNAYGHVGRDPRRGSPRFGRTSRDADDRRRMIGDGPNKQVIRADVYRALKALERRYGT